MSQHLKIYFPDQLIEASKYFDIYALKNKHCKSFSYCKEVFCWCLALCYVYFLSLSLALVSFITPRGNKGTNKGNREYLTNLFSFSSLFFPKDSVHFRIKIKVRTKESMLSWSMGILQLQISKGSSISPCMISCFDDNFNDPTHFQWVKLSPLKFSHENNVYSNL